MKRKLLKFVPIFFITALFPLVSFAIIPPMPVGLGPCDLVPFGLSKMICQTHEILNATLPILVALGVVYFVWGVVTYMIGSEEEAKKRGRNRIVYGIIGLAVIIGLWGLVSIVVKTFGLSNTAPTLEVINNPGTTSCTIPTSGAKLQNYMGYVTCTINNSVIPLIFALAMVMFVWGAVKFFLINADEEAKRTQGKQFMIWSIIALAVMFSVWGLIKIVGSTFGVGTSVLPKVGP